jgi:drug/metabolite transporter (DMT)-like permease
VLATATAVWGTVLMLPWLLGEVLAGAARLPHGAPGILSLLFLGLVVSAPTLVLYNYGAERLPAAISGIATAGIPALGYAFAVVLGEAPVLIKVIGGVIALAGILVATLSSPRPKAQPAPPGLP